MAQREPVFAAVEALAKAVVGAQGLKVAYEGVQNIPPTGGAVLAVNHTSYVDFIEAGLTARRAGRWPRYMMKAELRENRFVGFLMKHCKAIGVDRDHGADSYHEAVTALRGGETVIVYPEATISRSFELKEFKSGAARMAIEAGVPIVPIAVWGAQRIWSKGTDRNVGRHGYPINVVVGEPISPIRDSEDAAELTDRLRDSMSQVLERAQEGYPAPAGEAWVPARLGGGAPTPEQAHQLELQEFAERRAAREARDRPQS